MGDAFIDWLRESGNVFREAACVLIHGAHDWAAFSTELVPMAVVIVRIFGLPACLHRVLAVVGL